VHKNLVDLGLKLIKSKESRIAEKKQKLKAQANKIVINGGADDTKGKTDEESSYSEISNSENEDIYGGDFYGNSCEMEDLLELEKYEIERKNKAIQKRQLRRRQRNMDIDDAQLDPADEEEGDEDSEDDGEGGEVRQSAQRLKAIQHLIQKKQANKKSEMKAKLSYSFIN
jgi:hypothetical protein